MLSVAGLRPTGILTMPNAIVPDHIARAIVFIVRQGFPPRFPTDAAIPAMLGESDKPNGPGKKGVNKIIKAKKEASSSGGGGGGGGHGSY